MSEVFDDIEEEEEETGQEDRQTGELSSFP
jgi:hypothetical protein